MEVTFFEKPGCVGNARQKKLLKKAGHHLRVKDLLTEPWEDDALRAYFGTMQVKDWFNSSAPQVKSGALDIAGMDEQNALALMIENPILIRRPLMAVEGVKQSGFVSGPVFELLGVQLTQEGDLETCPMKEATQVCGEKQ